MYPKTAHTEDSFPLSSSFRKEAQQNPRLDLRRQIQLTPSPSFIAKNQLAKEGPHIVSPVIIPALKRDQDSQDMDILLCPVRALKGYLDRTKESRTGRHLLFISYKLGHSKDIQSSTISSWIKHTIQFCYSKVESADMVLTGVKAHDVRAFTASKAFYGGTSMDQIMQACHWKSHNTFNKFYLKDLTGQDQKEGSYHLGSFVAAQQVMPPSSQLQGRKQGRGHYFGNHLDRACQNPLTP